MEGMIVAEILMLSSTLKGHNRNRRTIGSTKRVKTAMILHHHPHYSFTKEFVV
jgi:hypothetical protein